MKIEKVNDNQIRCTLTREDLEDRHIKISELAYGSAKAKSLFKDMVEQANYEFGFETNDIPLMVEAIPLPSESIVLIITKVEYPDELDTRFSKFSEADDDFTDLGNAGQPPVIKGAADILELFERIKKEMRRQLTVSRALMILQKNRLRLTWSSCLFSINLMMCAGFRMCLTAFTAAEMTYTATLQAISTILWPTRVSILRRNSTRCAISFQSTHIRRTMCLPMKHFSRSMVM